MIEIYNVLLFQPLLNLLVYLYNHIGDIGISIIIITLLTRIILFYPSFKALKSQKALQDLQPKIKDLQNKHKDNKEEQTKALMDFYKEKKVNPFSSCLPMLIQLPIIFALYGVFRSGLSSINNEFLYSFIKAPESINTMFLGIINMGETNLPLAILAGGLQFIQAKLMMAKTQKNNQPKTKSPQGIADMSGMLSKQMLYLMPAMTVFIAMSLPSGLALYWVTTTLFAIGQQYVIMRPQAETTAK